MSKVVAEPDKIISYPITGDEKGGRLFLYGGSERTNVKHVVLLCAGFPDDHTAMAPFAARLAKQQNDILCGVACLTGYDDCCLASESKPWSSSSFRPQGYTLNEWALDLKAAARALRNEAAGDANYYTIFHDWASAVGTMYVNRALEEPLDASVLIVPSKVVFFDVLPFVAHPDEPNPPKPEKKGLYATTAEWLYRFIFAFTFWVQWRLSRHLAAGIFMISMTLLQLSGLTPGGKRDGESMEQNPKSLHRLTYMMFPYYHLLKAMIFEGKTDMAAAGLNLPKLSSSSSSLLSGILYMYGKDKNAQFHDANLVDFVASKPGCRCIGVEDAGHWLYLQQEDTCFEAVKSFLFE